jgi:hypothetical protein
VFVAARRFFFLGAAAVGKGRPALGDVRADESLTAHVRFDGYPLIRLLDLHRRLLRFRYSHTRRSRASRHAGLSSGLGIECSSR